MKNSESNSGVKLLFAIGAGLLAGGALGYYLASDEGKEMRDLATQKLNELEHEVKKVLNEQNEVINAKLKTAVDSSSEWLNQTQQQVNNQIQNAENTVEETKGIVENGFEKGVQKAKSKIEAHKVALNGSAS